MNLLIWSVRRYLVGILETPTRAVVDSWLFEGREETVGLCGRKTRASHELFCDHFAYESGAKMFVQ